VGQKNDVFVLREVKGPPTEPTELVLELNDTSEVIAVSKDKPFRRVDAYMADMKYDPEKITWTQKRVGAPLRFAGEDYNIVAITQNEVVLSAKSNNKKWPIKYNVEKAAP
jgi:tripartite-type tricarboxylate transporter receptor subunit TctC